MGTACASNCRGLEKQGCSVLPHAQLGGQCWGQCRGRGWKGGARWARRMAAHLRQPQSRHQQHFLQASEVLWRRTELAALGNKASSAAIPLALVVVTCPTRSSQLLRSRSWSYAMRHELLHLFAATWMQNSRTRPVSKCQPSQGASWNNTLRCCPTFMAGAEDVLQPALSSWPGVT